MRDKLSRRRFRNLLLRPRAQLSLAIAMASLGLVGMLTIIGIFASFIWKTLPEFAAAAGVGENFVQAEIVSLQPMFLFAILICMTLTVAAILVSIAYTHRLYGPTVPMLRQIYALRDGRYSKRIRLRKSDEFKDLCFALNELASILEKQHPKPPPQPPKTSNRE